MLVIGTLAGGIIGAYSTYFYQRRMDKDRIQKETLKQKNYDKTIRTIIHCELLTYKKYISKIDEKGSPVEYRNDIRYHLKKEELDEILSRYRALTNEFSTLSLYYISPVSSREYVCASSTISIMSRKSKFENVVLYVLERLFTNTASSSSLLCMTDTLSQLQIAQQLLLLFS